MKTTDAETAVPERNFNTEFAEHLVRRSRVVGNKITRAMLLKASRRIDKLDEMCREMAGMIQQQAALLQQVEDAAMEALQAGPTNQGICPVCHGSGEGAADQQCPTCEGTGAEWNIAPRSNQSE